jgi:tRNA threonylcarbamoyladenosine biosynthesis protein TsaB
MLLLAIDAATLHVSLALGEGPVGGRRLLAELEIPPGQNASERLPEAFVELLSQAGRPLEALEGFVVGTGPGSLTGLRVAMASVKGFAFARRLPSIGISSLEAMAHDLGPAPGLAVALVDARRGELYAGLFRRHADRVEVVEPTLAISASALAERLRGEQPLRLFGPGEPLVREAMAQAGVSYGSDGPGRPRAAALLALCPALPPFDAAALAALEPRYVRAPESEWAIKPRKPRA